MNLNAVVRDIHETQEESVAQASLVSSINDTDEPKQFIDNQGMTYSLSNGISASLMYVFLLLILVGCWSGCSSVNDCSSLAMREGNLGAIINSEYDDMPAMRLQTTLLYTSFRKRDENSKDAVASSALSALYETQIRADGSLSDPEINRSLPLNQIKGGSPAYAKLPEGNESIIVFSKLYKRGKQSNVDLYLIRSIKGIWTEPEYITELNTPAYESQPTLSQDGTTLVFVSDRAGGLGGSDLYVSYRQLDGKWSKPQNLGTGINTPYDDVTPSISSTGILYFASRGYNHKMKQDGVQSKQGSFDIVSANPTSGVPLSPSAMQLDGQQSSSAQDGITWGAASVLPAPFNSSADEISPLRWGDSLVFASKRKGGCGGYDIFRLRMCAPVQLRGVIIASESLLPRNGVLTILDSSGKFNQTQVSARGEFDIPLIPNRTYILRYVHPCSVAPPYEQTITAPCNSSATVVMKAEIPLPNQRPEFSLEEYNVPFFTTGYFQPNTTEQLNALRMKFAYNLIGTADSTRYIRNPGDEFDEFAPIVDSALNSTVDFILRAIEYRKSGCGTGGKGKIGVNVIGFFDPRPFAPNARYAGEPIEDSELGLSVKQGAKMTNELLSNLRAYFTIKALQLQLDKHPLYNERRDWVKWRISRSSADETSAPNTIKRRVELSVKFE
jgi:hypothetical protein